MPLAPASMLTLASDAAANSMLLPSPISAAPPPVTALSTTSPPAPLACSMPVLTIAFAPVSMTSAFAPVAAMTPSLCKVRRPCPICPAPETRLSTLSSTALGSPPNTTFPLLSDSTTCPPPVKLTPRTRISRSLSLPAELSAIVPLFCTVPPNGRIAPSPTVMIPVFVLTGSSSNTKFAADSAPACTPISVIVSPAPTVTTALPLPSSAIARSP